jgi:hypothetical protein
MVLAKIKVLWVAVELFVEVKGNGLVDLQSVWVRVVLL